MNYGKGATPGVAGIAILPFTGNNDVILTIAASLIALGVIVFTISLLLARKNSQTTTN